VAGDDGRPLDRPVHVGVIAASRATSCRQPGRAREARQSRWHPRTRWGHHHPQHTGWRHGQGTTAVLRLPPAPLAKLSPLLEMNTRPLAEVRADLEAQTHRRFIKTHTPLGALPWQDGVTYLHVGRDPRDAALSWDDHLSNMDFDRLFETRAAAVGLDDLAELGMDDAPTEPPDDPALRFWAWVEGDGVSESLSGLQALVHHSRTFWRPRSGRTSTCSTRPRRATGAS